jgi:hypothetical protein
MTNTYSDEEYQNFKSAWDELSDESRSRFIEEYCADLVYHDLNCRLMPGDWSDESDDRTPGVWRPCKFQPTRG